jgi:hypothetical protein
VVSRAVFLVVSYIWLAHLLYLEQRDHHVLESNHTFIHPLAIFLVTPTLEPRQVDALMDITSFVSSTASIVQVSGVSSSTCITSNLQSHL